MIEEIDINKMVANVAGSMLAGELLTMSHKLGILHGQKNMIDKLAEHLDYLDNYSDMSQEEITAGYRFLSFIYDYYEKENKELIKQLKEAKKDEVQKL